MDAVEKEFVAHLKGLPWLNQDRFLEQAKKVFGPSPLIQVDEELLLAVTGNVEPRVAAQALDQLKKLRDPLVKLFDLRTSGLPVLARLFKDQGSFQEYAKIDAPDRQWVGGYFSFGSRWLVLHLEPDSGSLAHEYCHALFEDDLGPLPPWFGEGIAQLYERYRLENGVPVGERGAALRTTRTGIGQNRLAPLAEFVVFKGAQFYDTNLVNLHYDASHALMAYAQEKGGLVAMVKEVRRARVADATALPTVICRAALEKALGADLRKIDADFRAWVLASRD
jgi:hypothetical protein